MDQKAASISIFSWAEQSCRNNKTRQPLRLLYDNSSPRPSEEFNFENSNADIESFSPSPILIKDSDSHMEEIDLSFNPDDPMPPSIKDDEDSEGDTLSLERLLHDDLIPLPDTLDFSYEVRVFLLFFTYPVTSPILLSSESEDKIFDPGITINLNTACYVQNRVLVVKPHNKTPYELFHGRTLPLSFMRPLGCLVTILNTKDHLGKFNGNADEGFFIGYYLNSKSFRVFNSRTRIVEENLHIRFSKSTSNMVSSEPDWLFDIDALTRIMSYEPIVASTQSNGFAGTKTSDNARKARNETKPVKDYILQPLWTADPPFS
nr:ribonuclease H-like domain-containing protein [Tanacetum cinerariifolium]